MRKRTPTELPNEYDLWNILNQRTRYSLTDDIYGLSADLWDKLYPLCHNLIVALRA